MPRLRKATRAEFKTKLQAPATTAGNVKAWLTGTSKEH